MSDFVRMQATIGGMSARPEVFTLFAELDLPSGILMIDLFRQVKPGEPEVRVPECAVVTNNPSTEDYDALFTEKHMRDAIADYFAFSGRGLLVLGDKCKQFDPSTKIEQDGVDERGMKYRFADVGNGQVAVVVLCWFAARQSGFARQLEAFDDLSFDNDVTTIGMAETTGDGRRVVRWEMGGKLPIGEDGWPLED